MHSRRHLRGASACATGELLPNGDCSGIAKNEKAYLEQFGARGWLLRDGDDGLPVRPSHTYSRWDFAQKDRYSQVNITEYAEHFHKLTLAGAQYGRENLHDSWTKNTVLGICIALSMLIAAIAGMGAMYLITSIGIKKLEEVAESLRKEEVVRGQNRRRKRDKVIELLEVKYAIKSQQEIRDFSFGDENASSVENIDPQVLKFSQAKCDEIEEFMTNNGWTEKTKYRR